MARPRLRGPVEGHLSAASVSDEVLALRLAQDRRDEAQTKQLQPLMDAHAEVCRSLMRQMKSYHQQVVDRLDLDPTSHTRASALWLLAGRCLGLLEALWVLVDAGVDNEALPTGRALHEATQLLFVLSDPDNEDLLRIWLADEGRDGYVSPAMASKAQGRFEEKLSSVMTEKGLQPVPSASSLRADLYDRMSRTAHNRRSSCVNSYWRHGRKMAYGVHTSPLRRAGSVTWAQAMTFEVVQVVGDALGLFYGPRFFFDVITPMLRRMDRVDQEAPLTAAVHAAGRSSEGLEDSG